MIEERNNLQAKSTDPKQREIVIEIERLHKRFKVGKNIISVLKGIDLEIYSTDFAVIFGPSGCGKSTLLNIILGIDEPSSGTVVVRETDLFKLLPDKRSIFRAKKMGMVHQVPYWIKSLNVIENVAMPLIIEGHNEKNAVAKAKTVLSKLEIGELAKQIPTQLSSGEQQKVGLARALVTDPWIILADEPTGNLDTKSGDELMNLLQVLNKVQKRTILLVTHNEKYWNCGNRRIEMEDGQIVKDNNR